MAEPYTPTDGEVRQAVRRGGFIYKGCNDDPGVDFDAWLEAHDRTERAAAWDEGYGVAMHEASGDYDLAAAKVPTNPYRIERSE